MTTNLVVLIESKLCVLWSPEQISGWLRVEYNIFISNESIYLHIWTDKRRGGQLFKYLRRKGKAYQPRSKDKQVDRGVIRNRVSIDERPSVVEDKSRKRDWDLDLVTGKGHRGAFVTIVEWKTSFTVSMRVDDKSARAVTAATIAILQPFKNAVHTITADNGKEFAYHEVMTEYLKCGVYFTDPYCSWQRGLNENINRLLCEFRLVLN